MTPHKAIYFLISFYWFLGMTVQMLAQANEADSMGETRPIRMAVMPFCNESGDPDAETAPDPEELYQYILGTLQGLYACQKPVVWVTDTRNGQSVLENKLDSVGRCVATPEGGICANIGADLLIKGEFITNEYGVAEIYYSFENCEGIYSARIEYLTSQPLRVNMNHRKQAYRMISEAIQKDLQHFLQCEKGVSPLDADSVVQEGINMYSGADTNALNYLRAVDLMEQVLKTQPDHTESLYYIGLAYFSLEEYERAFSCFQKAGDIYEANTYSQFCELESKPARWYDSSLKRRKWWNRLRDDWKNVFRVKVWNMEGEKEPTDEQLSILFSETSLSFDDYALPDLSGLEALTNLTHLSCNRTSLKNLRGIEKLVNLTELSVNENEITSIKPVARLPFLTKVYCEKNPLENLDGLEKMESLAIFCKGSVSKKEAKRVEELGIEVKL